MVVIIRYGEIALKGLNRALFEKRLVGNIRDCLRKNKIIFDKILRVRGRILICTGEYCDCLRNVFGIVSFSPAIETKLELREIKRAALSIYTKGSFRISARRLEKKFLTSKEINEKVGKYIVEKRKAKVDLENPKVDIGIEIFNDKSYIFNQKIRGLGGLPVGVSGRVAVLLEDQNSVKAAKLMLKRGCETILIKKKNIDYRTLLKFCHGFKLEVVQRIPKNVDALVVSETLKNLKKRKTKLPILRPLIAH